MHTLNQVLLSAIIQYKLFDSDMVVVASKFN
jgi:hypothetical protein